MASSLAWQPELPRLRPLRLVAAWLASALGLLLAAGIVPGAEVRGFAGAVLVAAIVAVLNALLPPVIAALRLPFTVGVGFLLVLALDAAMLLAGRRDRPRAAPRRRLLGRARWSRSSPPRSAWRSGA